MGEDVVLFRRGGGVCDTGFGFGCRSCVVLSVSLTLERGQSRQSAMVPNSKSLSAGERLRARGGMPGREDGGSAIRSPASSDCPKNISANGEQLRWEGEGETLPLAVDAVVVGGTVGFPKKNSLRGDMVLLGCGGRELGTGVPGAMVSLVETAGSGGLEGDATSNGFSSFGTGVEGGVYSAPAPSVDRLRFLLDFVAILLGEGLRMAVREDTGGFLALGLLFVRLVVVLLVPFLVVVPLAETGVVGRGVVFLPLPRRFCGVLDLVIALDLVRVFLVFLSGFTEGSEHTNSISSSPMRGSLLLVSLGGSTVGLEQTNSISSSPMRGSH